MLLLKWVKRPFCKHERKSLYYGGLGSFIYFNLCDDCNKRFSIPGDQNG